MENKFIELKVEKTEVTDVSFGRLRLKTFVPTKRNSLMERSNVFEIGIDSRVL